MHSRVTDPTGVVHRWVFDFELAFLDPAKLSAVERLMNDWWWMSLPYVLFYVFCVFAGQAWMKQRNAKFELRTPLFVWNAFLAAFSFWGVCRSLPELIHTMNHHGFMYSICDPTYKRGITGLWFVVLFFFFFPR